MDTTAIPTTKWGPTKVSRLQQTHPRLDIAHVRVLKAMYRGGGSLLRDREVMARVFPKYTHEQPAVYNERIARAYYEPIFAMVINQVSAGLAQDPIHIDTPMEDVEMDDLDGSATTVQDDSDDSDYDFDKEDPPPGQPKPPTPPPTPQKSVVSVPKMPKIDQYWLDLMDDATAPNSVGFGRKTYDQVVRDAAVEGLVTGWGWVQAEMPKPDEVQPLSLADQEKAGQLRAYLLNWPTDQVTDWEEQNGELVWVRTYECVIDGSDPTKPRDTKRHCWTIWDAAGWTRYEITESKNQPFPASETEIAPTESGTHSFGCVPWIRFDVSTEGGVYLHVGEIIESLCRAYFNRQNGESFQWTQFYYQQLYEFLGPEIAGIDTDVSDAQKDPQRAKRTRSPGQVHVRGAGDDAKFVGPSMQGADVGRNAMQDLRDAILRVVAQMALAQDTSGAMLRRSADSKRQDSVAQEVLLGAVGKLLVIVANALANLLALGRGDTEEPPRLRGYERFDITDAESLINQSVLVESIDIPSATYQVMQKWNVACTHLGDSVSPEIREKILKELMQVITQDQLLQKAMPPPPPHPPLLPEDNVEEKADSRKELKEDMKS